MHSGLFYEGLSKYLDSLNLVQLNFGQDGPTVNLNDDYVATVIPAGRNLGLYGKRGAGSKRSGMAKGTYLPPLSSHLGEKTPRTKW
jgi:hypothetical protein